MNERIGLITGATGGLGKAMAAALAADGLRVLVHTRRDVPGADALCATIAAAGGRAEVVCFDIRDPRATADAIAGLVRVHHRIDVLVNNAGVVVDTPFAMMDEASWADVIDTNLTGTFRVCRAVSRAMMSQRSGVIINVASVAGLRASPYQANYSAAKAGVLGFSRTLARELGPKGIRVNTVIPGLIDAGMGARADRRYTDALIERIPLQRSGTAEEVATAVRFLASDAARYISGAELTVDGGLST